MIRDWKLKEELTSVDIGNQLIINQQRIIQLNEWVREREKRPKWLTQEECLIWLKQTKMETNILAIAYNSMCSAHDNGSYGTIIDISV